MHELGDSDVLDYLNDVHLCEETLHSILIPLHIPVFWVLLPLFFISQALCVVEEELLDELNNGENNTKSKWYTPITRCLSLAVDPTFIKPFSFLCVIFCLALEWGGFPALAFYMVPLLE